MLEDKGFILKEILPSIDITKDIPSQMEFNHKTAEDLCEIDQKIFKNEKMDLIRLS